MKLMLSTYILKYFPLIDHIRLELTYVYLVEYEWSLSKR